MEKSKKLRKNAVILFIVLILVLYFVLKDNFANILTALLEVDLKWLFIAFLLALAYLFFQACSCHMITKEYSKKIKFKDIFSLTIITQFFNGITPFSSGGQPMEVYYLNKLGIKPTCGTNIILQKFILYQMALVTHGIIAIALNYKFHFFAEVPILRQLTLIGFIINSLVAVILLFISFSTKFNNFVIKLAISLLSKLKVVKNKEKTIETWEKRLSEFHSSAELLKNKKSLFIKGYLYNFVGLLAFYLVPLFVIYSVGNFNINFIEAVSASAYVLIIGAFVPIPGGSGGIEYGFMQFFGNFVHGPVLSASLLIWRFITYYLPMIFGAITISFFKGGERK